MPPGIAIESPLTDDAARLIEGSSAALAEFYSADECFSLDPHELAAPNVRFFVARLDGVAVGCVALAIEDGYAEVKRMFVGPSARGHGIGRALMAALERTALSNGITLIRLETGDKLRHAVALYEDLGFTRCGAFGDYEDIPASMFMEKQLA